MNDEIREQLRYTRIPFSCSEAKSADGFELKEGMIIHWDDRGYTSSGHMSSGCVACSYAVIDPLQGGPVVVLFDGEMCFMASPTTLFATESGLYDFLVKKVQRDLIGEQGRVEFFSQLAEDNRGFGPVFSGPIIDWQAISDTAQ